MDTTKAITHISLCAGYGGIDLGLARAIPNLLTIAFSEIEAFACANLVAKMEAGLLEPAPIWTDLKTFPWEEFRGKVDIISGGFPCQPFSAAGKRAGDEDARHLFPYILDGIGRCRPSLVFLENVEGILSSKLAGDGWRDPAGTPVLLHVFRELERIGYKATAGVFSASEVGAPHQRKRVFIMAHRSGGGHNWRALQDRVCGRGVSELSQPFAGGCSEIRSKVEGCGHGPSELAHNNNQRGKELTWEKSVKSQYPPLGTAILLADNLCNGSPSGIPRQEQRHEGITGIANDDCGQDIWPSRPGEPQHEWEPPRVVGSVPKKLADFCTRDAQQGGDSSSSSGEGVGEWGESTDAMPDGGSSLCGGDKGDCVGNASNEGYSRAERRGSQPEKREPIGHITQPTGAGSHRKTEPSLGGNPDGASCGMDYAELQVSCDNRTDELRLLGNGVVPATATKSFITLYKKLFNDPTF